MEFTRRGEVAYVGSILVLHRLCVAMNNITTQTECVNSIPFIMMQGDGYPTCQRTNLGLLSVEEPILLTYLAGATVILGISNNQKSQNAAGRPRPEASGICKKMSSERIYVACNQ